MLGIGTRVGLDGFFRAHGIDESISEEELERRLRDLDRLGI